MIRRESIEDIYRLSELQESLLLHHLQHGADDSGLLQMRATLSGPLRVEAFWEAWRDTMLRHPVLRSSVHWMGVQHPVQVVSKKADVETRILDWRQQPEPEQTRALQELLREDREQGVDLGTAPVMRLALIRTSERVHEFVWTSHHILLDGWSSALVIREVMDRYQTALRGAPPPTEPASLRFRDYVAWSREAAHPEAEAFWRQHRLTERCLVTGERWSGRSSSAERGSISVELASRDEIEAWARRNRLTPSSLFFGIWGLTVSEHTGGRFPLFGAATSGRSADLAGIEATVGMFANTVPVPLSVEEGQSLREWFGQVHAVQQGIRRYEHCSFGRIMDWCGATWQGPMFDTLLVLTNFVGADALKDGLVASAAEGTESLRLHDFVGGLTSGYPLTLAVGSGERPRLTAHFDPGLLEPAVVERLLDRFVALCRQVLDDDARPVGAILQRAAEGAETPTLPTAPKRRRDEADVAPPEDAFEGQLMRIWSELLDLDEVGRHDNFFDSGGHSLLLPRLIERVRRDFDVELPLGVIFQAPTVKDIAAYVRSSDPEPSWPSLVGIRPEGSRPPLYMVHGLGGEIGQFYNLAAYLDADQPLYALQSPVDPSSEVPEIAARYLTEIRANRPSGPYLLGGYCLGGTIAFEMARQLEAAGERVDLVALVDSVAPGAVQRPREKPPKKSVGERVIGVLTRNPLETLRRAVRRLGIRIREWRNPRPPSVTMDPDTGEVTYRGLMPQAFHGAASRHLTATRAYEAGTLGAETWLFRTRSPRFDPDLGWGRFVTGNLHLEWLEGPHPEVLKEPYLAISGPRIAAVLETRAPALKGAP